MQNWIIEETNQQDYNTMKVLIEFVYKLYEDIFPAEALYVEPLIIKNDKNRSGPILVLKHEGVRLNPIEINTSVKDINYWSQFIYQFAHELCHYVLRQYKINKDDIISWIEETICEAMSIYILKIASEKWVESDLYKRNCNYGICIKEYYENVIGECGNDRLKNCDSIDELIEINRRSVFHREERIYERNLLFEKFFENPNEIMNVAYYSHYIKNDVCIDFDRWKCNKHYSEIIDVLEIIHPVIHCNNI